MYQDNYVYVDGQVYCTEEEYAQQADTIANSVPADIQADKVEWMPLGVFAVSQANESEPTMFLQLAISKEGIVAGTLTNVLTNTAQEVEGMVDQNTQRAAWKIVGKEHPVMETGIYNLTQEQTPILVHFSPEQTQTWMLVRMEEPAATGAATP